jgi:uncharacterized protein (DUF433 family)
MINTATIEPSVSAPANALIVETSRGPSIAGRGITVFAIMDYLKAGLDRELIKQSFLISDEQLDAALQYIADHREEVEREYEEIVRYSEELRARYEPISRACSPFPPDMPWAEKDELLRQELARKQQNQLSQNSSILDHSSPRELVLQSGAEVKQ